ncbi:MAG: glycosyltransferase [Candidatus Omnitrophota bacterium]
MIKVLMFNKLHHAYRGGVERSVCTLCNELKDKVAITVLAANTICKTERDNRDGYPVIRVASLGSIMSSVHLSFGIPFWWNKIDYDLVHFHFPSPVAELYCLALTDRKKPIVVTYHSDIVGRRVALSVYRPFLRQFFKRTSRIIATSEAMVAQSPFLSAFKEKCTVIPLGIDVGKFNVNEVVRAGSRAIQEKFCKPLVLFVGRLVKYKGTEYLIRAMQHVPAVLLVVGDGPEAPRLKKIVQECGLADKVIFLGEISDGDLPIYYHASQCVVLPSVANNEAFGITQLEAQACARPVISTSLVTGVSFVNLDGVTGIIVPPRSSAALSAAINRLLGDSGLCARLGQAGRQRVEAQFSSTLMAEKTFTLYKEVLSSAR